MTYQLHHGNCLDIMPLIERESVDAIVTDPPYGLGFMGKDWDHGVPGMHFWLEALRCAKPGAHLLAFGGTRTFHRLAVAIEDAGWEIRDTVMWVYGSGFPKSHDVSKAIDREAGAEREVIGTKQGHGSTSVLSRSKQVQYGYRPDGDPYGEYDGTGLAPLTQPATPLAAEWSGWGTALKPAWEPIIVARKPLQGTVAENVQRYGTGAMNIDGCRIETDAPIETGRNGRNSITWKQSSKLIDAPNEYQSQGRWPANLIHDGSAEVLAGFPMTSSGTLQPDMNIKASSGWSGGSYADRVKSTFTASTGSAARFFYCAKASKQDRDEGCEGLEEVRRGAMDGNIDDGDFLTGSGNPRKSTGYNHHPTVKPTSLMRYLCRLVTPPHGVILDPFMGSGSTGKAAILEGFNFIGVDTEIEYVEIAARRIEHACEKVGIVVEQPMMFDTKRKTADKPKQLLLL